jgi:hypothetical protein
MAAADEAGIAIEALTPLGVKEASDSVAAKKGKR